MAQRSNRPKISEERGAPRKSNTNCCVKSCRALAKTNPQLSFHKFPPAGQIIQYIDESGNSRSEERRKVWERVLKMDKAATRSSTICSQHFTEKDYNSPAEVLVSLGSTRRLLKKDAIPSRNLSNITKEKFKKYEIHPLERRENCTVSSPSGSTLLHRRIQKNQSNNPCKKQKTINNSGPIHSAFIAQIIRNDHMLKAFTGVSSSVLIDLIMQIAYQTSGNNDHYNLKIKERVVLVFLKLKMNLSFTAICSLFTNMTLKACKYIFYDTINILVRIILNYKYTSKNAVEDNSKATLDNVKIVVLKRSNLNPKDYILGPTPVVYAFYKTVPLGVNIFDNLLFITDRSLRDQKIIINQFQKLGTKNFSLMKRKKQCDKNAERVIAQLKQFKCFKSKVPADLLHVLDDILLIICGVFNLNHQV